MANNATLMGMIINNTDATSNNALAVGASGASGARIINNTITATQTGGTTGTAHGIDVVSGSSNLTVSGNTITASGGAIPLASQVNGAHAPVPRPEERRVGKECVS